MSTYWSASLASLACARQAIGVQSSSGLALLFLLGACTTTPDSPQTAPPPTENETPAVASPNQPQTRPPKPTRPRPGSARKAAPIPDQPLNIVASCAFQDETGYSGQLNLTVDQAVVSRFAATVKVPRRGQCRFDLKHFQQTRQLPNVELRHRRDECTVRLWEQEHRVTVAFDGCRRQCEGNARDYLWPILADRRDNTCA